MSTRRNDACPCGSGRKYKQCCLGRDQAAEQVEHRFGITSPGPGGPGERGVWQVDLTPLPVRIETDAAARPALALAVEAGVVLDVELLGTPPSEPDAIATELERLITRTAGRTGSWPDVVQVREPELAEHLAARLAERGARVEARGRLDVLDAVAADLRQHVAGAATGMPAASSPETWRGWGLSRETIAEIFAAAAEFWRSRPWRWITSDDPLFVDEGTHHPWLSTVLGNGGEQFGLALYADAEDFFRIFEEDGPAAFAEMTGAVLSLTFERASELPPRMRREVAAAGWEVAAPEAYPVLIAVNTPGGGLPRAAAEDLIRVLRSVPGFVGHHRDALDPELSPLEPLEWRSPDTGVVLRLEAGPGGEMLLDLPWDPVERLEPCLPTGPAAAPEAALDRFADTGIDATGIEALTEAELRVVDRFADALRADGLSQATVQKHALNAATFVELLTGFQGVPLRAVTEFDLRSILFDLYPRKVADAAHRADAMPVSLTRFFRFLDEFEGLSCPWAPDVLAERDAYAERIDSFPGGSWWDEEVADWRAMLEADLIARALVHWPNHADGTPWGPTMGPVEAELNLEVQRRWLVWRDETIHQGTDDPHAVREAAIERQLQWEQAPHTRLGGRTPLEAIQAERAERSTQEEEPGPHR